MNTSSLQIKTNTTSRSKPQPLLADVFQSLRRWPLWTHLAWMDIKMRYRRSSLGPWWITISMAIFVATLGIVYGKLFKLNPSDYIPFLTSGYLLWVFITSCVTESSEIFMQSQGLLKQIRVPYLVHVFRCIARNLIIMFHNFLIYFVVAAYFSLSFSWVMILAVPGMLLILLNIVWVCLLISMIGTRYRDIPPLINSLLTIIFFISPITWMPKLIGENSIIIQLNPVTHALDLVRSPLLGTVPSVFSWDVMIGFFVIGTTCSLILYAKYKDRIPFWVG